MDYSKQFEKQIEYYKYFENQKENYTDLTDENNPNDSIKKLAEILFNKSINSLDYNLSGILVEDGMNVADIFCMLIELVLYGLDILTKSKNTIFDLKESTEDIVYIIKTYLKSAGFDMVVKQDFVDDGDDCTDDPCTYRKKDNYYCEIIQKSPLLHEGWNILDYSFLCNNKFKYNSTTNLENFKTFFISNKNKIFIINFRYANIKK
ncbi:MAG: hypothetical protein Satyrvirus9_14 [Satyrvirus sp.]|uniref:Uncharacterized protein n=1 Tax=Satyrvirus sp. TaxID=2487771 RepID=A0A3G5ADU3_9VIRU|nr:MAG: hypothetical protein Satyrvirus9_14 [Satyrvirus sp.]